jgi:uncharacterized alpha-E superfamily protein
MIRSAGASAERDLGHLHASLGVLTIKVILQQGLQEFLDDIQHQLIKATSSLAKDFLSKMRLCSGTGPTGYSR